MKINTKTRYGLRTMIQIGMHNQKGVLQKDIAKSQNLSEKYLDHIIAGLKSAGLITNVGGKGSGYKLTKNIEDIRIYDIYKAFNDHIKINECLDPEISCNREQHCSARMYWQDLNQTIKQHLEETRLNQLVEKERELNRPNEEMDFQI